MSSTKAFLILPLHAHELERASGIEARLQGVARKHGLTGTLEVIRKRPRPTELPVGATIVTDCPSRLGRNTAELAKFLSVALQRGVGVVIPGFAHLAIAQGPFTEALGLLDTLVRVNGLFRAKRTAEGVFLARSRGVAIGRSPISEEVRQAVLDTYERLGSIRGTVRALKKNGVEVGRTTIQRIVNSKKEVQDE